MIESDRRYQSLISIQLQVGLKSSLTLTQLILTRTNISFFYLNTLFIVILFIVILSVIFFIVISSLDNTIG